MDVQVLDLDGSFVEQTQLLGASGAHVIDLRWWGPRIRLACRFGSFTRFERQLDARLGKVGPRLTFYGSGDFHHVSLALVRRLRTPFNLLVLDKHPDWMGGVPLLHCGTWLREALRSPLLRRVYHVGGELDFDNAYRFLAPWDELLSGRVVTIPAVRRFLRGRWSRLPTTPLRPDPDEPATPRHVEALLGPLRSELAARPLYISLDKDVMTQADAVVNWDSGLLTLGEVEAVLGAFRTAAGGKLAGIDVLGDWSPVEARGCLRRVLHLTEHPRLSVDRAEARQTNERTNLALLEALSTSVTRPPARPGCACPS